MRIVHKRRLGGPDGGAGSRKVAITTAKDYVTRFGSLDNYEKGRIEIIDDDPKHYAFSNMFEVASISRPYEKVAVGINREYVLETLRAEGTSPWYAARHDESVIVMDGEVEIRLRKLGEGDADLPEEGSVALPGEPTGPVMGHIRARRGHMALLPVGAAYQFHAQRPGVLLIQTIQGPDTVFKWAEIAKVQV
jgi:hypothetical protein